MIISTHKIPLFPNSALERHTCEINCKKAACVVKYLFHCLIYFRNSIPAEHTGWSSPACTLPRAGMTAAPPHCSEPAVSRPLIGQNCQFKYKLFIRSWEVKGLFRKSGVLLSKTHTTGRIILKYEITVHNTSENSIVPSVTYTCYYSCQHYNTLSAATRCKAYCTYCIMRTAPDPLCRKGVGRVFLMLGEETVPFYLWYED